MVETKEWTTEDKSTWGDGPWQTEPDKRQWEDPATGLPCLIKRNYFGALCGYVGISEGHKWFGQDYDGVDGIDVHGGLTYSAFCADGDDESQGICHVTADHKPVWWLGFDCAHAGDYSPGSKYAFGGDEYRDLAYVMGEVARLAAQLN